ncbi:heterokaryon incompatibility protein [Ilyonectria destructans]|nr:heterokaryon incompatibility protein [Ilyonectria destructans]
MAQPTMYRYRTQDELEDDVEAAFATNCDGDRFLPFDKLGYFVTKQTVESALQAAHVENVAGLVDFVLDEAPRIFLILAILGKLSMLGAFRGSKIDDSSLPISVTQDDCGQPLEKPPSKKPCDIFTGWAFRDRDLFGSLQYRFTAPIFDDTFRFRFHRKRILPYLRSPTTSSTAVSSGFFGEVWRKEIHPAHLPIVAAGINAESTTVAVKIARHVEGFRGAPEKEASNLHQLLRSQYKSQHLIKPIAAYEIIDGDRFLVFPWADGGDLGCYWNDHAQGALKQDDVRWVLGEFVGLFKALAELHESNCRHGDLKPDNILWFKNEGPGGRLQIADLGLATFHRLNTQQRKAVAVQTTTASGTKRYEPPEEDQRRENKDPRPRAYDIWSMGCTLLELLVWLVYGGEGLKELKRRTKAYFWSVSMNKYIVAPEVEGFMDALAANPNVCRACQDLLKLVRSRLLCIPVADYDNGSQEGRATALEVHSSLQNILGKCQDDSYLTVQGLDRSSMSAVPGVVYKDKEENALAPPPVERGVLKAAVALPRVKGTLEEFDGTLRLDRQATDIDHSRPRATLQAQMTIHDQQSSKLTDHWDMVPNNTFARTVINLLGWERVVIPPGNAGKARLCSSCSAIQFTHHLFDSRCDLSMLKTTSQTCDLCRLLSRALENVDHGPFEFVTLSQTSASVSIENGPTLLSLYTEPGTSLNPDCCRISSRQDFRRLLTETGPNMPHGSQLGFPTLFKPASPDQFTIMKEWIRLCDTAHEMCRRKQTEEVLEMPTRLVQVEDPVRLVETSSLSPSRYAAFSHRWGSLKDDEKFCTYKNNIAQLESSMDVEKLPRVFLDAVTVTRGLGIKYLWIDSLCIIQDDEEDWENESAKMEQVFSSAYITISASSARSSLEGFLADRPRRSLVQVETKDAGVIHACIAIDDFHLDVELGELNKRGWVLQERALSRRSIYFTSTQVYWECGAGVQCETLGLIRNNKAAFLGDPNFPKLALDYYRDGRQVLIQDLYERYSSLAFTRFSDRAVAILGLQKRLGRALQTQAAFGCFAKYFARGLLWKRGQPQSLDPIVQPASRFVPSWSWLSRKGSIRYMELEFEKISWATGKDFESPFAQRETVGARRHSGDMTVLRGLARKLCMTEEDLRCVIFDTEQVLGVADLRCVVIGRDKAGIDAGNERLHALIIGQASNKSGVAVFERVGAASLRAKHVDNKGEWIDIL